MKNWNLVFDVALCTGCRNCVLEVEPADSHWLGEIRLERQEHQEV